jgi:phosphotransferase system IIA component
MVAPGLAIGGGGMVASALGTLIAPVNGNISGVFHFLSLNTA